MQIELSKSVYRFELLQALEGVSFLMFLRDWRNDDSGNSPLPRHIRLVSVEHGTSSRSSIMEYCSPLTDSSSRQ